MAKEGQFLVQLEGGAADQSSNQIYTKRGDQRATLAGLDKNCLEQEVAAKPDLTGQSVGSVFWLV